MHHRPVLESSESSVDTAFHFEPGTSAAATTARTMAAAVQDPEEEDDTSDGADVSSNEAPSNIKVKTSNFETSIKSLISQYEKTQVELIKQTRS